MESWVDANIPEKFTKTYINRNDDLLLKIVPSIILTPKVIDELSVFNQTTTTYATEKLFQFVASSTSPSGSRFVFAPSTPQMFVMNISPTELSALPLEYHCLSSADQEGAVLGLKGIPLISDDRHLHNRRNITCVHSSYVIVAGIIKKVISFKEANEIYRNWGNKDRKWVHPTMNFMQVYNEIITHSQDKLNLIFFP